MKYFKHVVLPLAYASVLALLIGCATPSDQSSNDNNALLWTFGGALFGARAAQVGSVPGVAVGNAAQNYGLAQAGRSQVTVNNNSSQPPASTPPRLTRPAIGDTKYVAYEKLTSGAIYEGSMKLCDDGMWQPHGTGTYTCPDGTRFVGEFKDGSLDGQGTRIEPNGGRYVGEYQRWQAKRSGNLHLG